MTPTVNRGAGAQVAALASVLPSCAPVSDAKPAAPYCECKRPDPLPIQLGAATIGHLCVTCRRRIKKPQP